MNYSVAKAPQGPAPSPGDVKAAFEKEGLSASTWSNGPGDRYSEHTHSYHKVLYCLEGTIVFHIDGEDAELHAGDRLDLAPGIRHAATVGPKGVVCMEAAKY